MKLAYVSTTDRGATDRLLSAFAEQLKDRGVTLAGVVQTNTECADGYKCDMDLLVLPDGDTIRISQSLGSASRGCRLDPSELERAVGLVSHSLGGHADLLIINKFGKHEADGRGFRPVVGQALEQGVPVLVGLNGLNKDKFLSFAGDFAEEVPGDLAALHDWFAKVQAEALPEGEQRASA